MSQSGQPREKKQRLLTREQQVVWRKENKGNLKGKPKDERKAARENMITQLEAMSEGDRAKFIKELQAKWDALPEAEKAAMKKKEKGGGRKAGGGKKKGKKAAAHEEDDD